MGEARNRGPKAARVRAALATAHGLAQEQPVPALTCSGCQQTVAQVEAVDVSGLKGLAQAFRGHCAACDKDTWAVRGEAASVKAFYAALEKASGQAVQLGTARARPAS